MQKENGRVDSTNNDTDDENINTQEIIEDARERRALKIRGETKFKCEQCEFVFTSKTLLKRHNKNAHIEVEEQQSQEMRLRYTCDKCDFKTTSKTVLKAHKELHHEKKVKQMASKRKECDICGKRFNKETTFNHHMKIVHEGMST